MEYKFEIPHIFKWMARGDKKRYVQYVKDYFALVHPGLKPVRIMGKYAILVRKENEVKPNGQIPPSPY